MGGSEVIQDLGETFSDCGVGDWDGGGMDVEGDAAVLGGAVLGGWGGEGEVGREGGSDEVGCVDEVCLEGLRDSYTVRSGTKPEGADLMEGFSDRISKDPRRSSVLTPKPVTRTEISLGVGSGWEGLPTGVEWRGWMAGP